MPGSSPPLFTLLIISTILFYCIFLFDRIFGFDCTLARGVGKASRALNVMEARNKSITSVRHLKVCRGERLADERTVELVEETRVR